MTALDRLVDALERFGCNPRNGSASCPAEGHFPDKNPSLSYSSGDGRALANCQRGCRIEDVLAPLDMTVGDLFDAPRGEAHQPDSAHYPYTDADGRLLFEVVRFPDKQFRQRRKDSSQPGGWTWKLGSDLERPLYRLPKVIEAVAAGERIYVCEGEKDVHTLELLGLTATTKAGGAGGIRWAKVSLHPLDGAEIVALPDHDIDGTKYALGLVEAIGDRAKVRIVHLPGLPDKGDVSDWVAAGGTREQLEAMVHEVFAAGSEHEPEWPEIVPLSGSGPADDFPVEELPQRVRAMVEAVAASSATPVDFAGGVALGAVAALASRGVSIRPTGGAWTPPANLYLAGVMPSGEGKSPVYRELLGPLHEIEADLQTESRDEVTAARTRKTVAEQAAEKATRDASAGKGTVAEAIALAQEADAIEVPPTPRLLTMEPTPEAIVRICGGNGGTVAVVSDEGAEVFALMSRYSASGAANLGVYLNGFEGDIHVVDRVSKESVKIPRLVLSLVLAVQPSVLDDLARESANRDRGLLARFLICVPVSSVGSRPTRRPEVPGQVRAGWVALLRRIARQVHGRTEPVVLELDVEAQEVWWTWCSTVEPRLHPDTGDLRHCVDWGSKAQAHVARLCALLHVAGEYPLEAPVTASTMWSAVTLWEYFATHAKQVFATMYEADEVRIARKILRWIERTAVDQFSQREAWKGTEGGVVKDTAGVQTGLGVLVERGYLRLLPSFGGIGGSRGGSEKSRGGRPASPSYAVNPAAKTSNTAKTSDSSSIYV